MLKLVSSPSSLYIADMRKLVMKLFEVFRWEMVREDVILAACALQVRWRSYDQYLLLGTCLYLYRLQPSESNSPVTDHKSSPSTLIPFSLLCTSPQCDCSLVCCSDLVIWPHQHHRRNFQQIMFQDKFQDWVVVCCLLFVCSSVMIRTSNKLDYFNNLTQS